MAVLIWRCPNHETMLTPVQIHMEKAVYFPWLEPQFVILPRHNIFVSQHNILFEQMDELLLHDANAGAGRLQPVRYQSVPAYDWFGYIS